MGVSGPEPRPPSDRAGHFRRGLASRVHLADKAVASAGDCVDITRFVSRVLQCISQPPDRRVDPVIELDDGVGGPEPLLNLLAQNDLARTFQQNAQELKRLLL